MLKIIVTLTMHQIVAQTILLKWRMTTSTTHKLVLLAVPRQVRLLYIVQYKIGEIEIIDSTNFGRVVKSLNNKYLMKSEIF